MRSPTILPMALLMMSGAAFAKPADFSKAPEVPLPERLPLSDVVRNTRMGLHFQELPGSPWPREILLEQASQFVRFRRGQMGAKDRLMWMADCASRPAENIFCEFMGDRLSRKRGAGDSTGDKSASSLDASEIGKLMLEADIEALQGQSESALHRALRQFDAWQPLEKLAKKLKTASSCPSLPLMTSVAQKAEEYLPAPEYRSIAVGLYSRVAACAPAADPLTHKARFRSSLLRIWDGKCQEAEPALQDLVSQPQGEFHARALFWKARCAKESGNKIALNALEGKLLKEYPLSYHGLVLSGAARTKKTWATVGSAEPELSFRSQARPELNAWIEAAEALQRVRAFDLALELLNAQMPGIELSEVSVRLYAAVLMQRSGARIELFRLLSGVFRDDPGAVSRSVLELYYPLVKFEVLAKHRDQLDPMLAAALIRQESGFNAHARSIAGAMGLMQLLPETAKRMDRRVSARSLLDPKVNVRVGVKYFKQLLDRFGDAELALAAYNAGPEKVEGWLKRYATEDRLLFLDLIPFAETRNYVALIGRNYYWYKRLYSDRGTVRRKGAKREIAAAQAKAGGLFPSMKWL